MYYQKETSKEQIMEYNAHVEILKIPYLKMSATTYISIIKDAIKRVAEIKKITPYQIEDYKEILNLVKQLTPLIREEKKSLYNTHPNMDAVVEAVRVNQNLELNLPNIIALNLAAAESHKNPDINKKRD